MCEQRLDLQFHIALLREDPRNGRAKTEEQATGLG